MQAALAELDAEKIALTEKGAANGVATLGADSKIPGAQLPALAIGETFTVTSQAAMLALSAQRGDVAVRTDLDPDGFFLLATDDPSQLANWVQITAPGAVTSVNGRAGAVTGLVDVIDAGAGTELGPVGVAPWYGAKRNHQLAFNSAITAKSRDGTEYNVARMNNNPNIDAGIHDDMLIGDPNVKWLSLAAAEGVDLISKDIVDVRYMGNHIASVNTRLVQRRSSAGYDVGIASMDTAGVVRDRLVCNSYVADADSYVRIINAALRLHKGDLSTNRLPTDDATFEGSVGTWVGHDANATITRSTASPITGVASGRFRCETAGTRSVRTADGTAGVAVPPNASWRVKVKAKPVTTVRNFYVQVRQFTSAGALATSWDSPQVSEVSGSAVELTFDGAFTPTAGFASVRVFFVGTSAGEEHDIDDVLLAYDDISLTAPDWRLTPISDWLAEAKGRTRFTADATGQVPVTVRGLSGQTADLHRWETSDGASPLRVSAAGMLQQFDAAGTTEQSRINAGFFRGSGITNLTNTGAYVSPNGSNVVVIGRTTTSYTFGVRPVAAQTADIMQVQDSGSVILSRFDKGGYFMTRKTAAPADGDLAAGEMALWFDSTNGAAKLMVKAKEAGGTVRTGSLALA